MDAYDPETDLVADEAHPNITAYDPRADDTRWPDSWGSQPTERDKAVIDALIGEETS